MDEDRGFSARDRRTSASDTGSDQPKHQLGDSATQRSAQEAAPAQDLDFSTFVISLASSAQVNLGAIPHPETNQISQNIPAAKQMINILAMLMEKTKGNLAESESALLERVLFNLRMHYVRTVEGQKKSGG